MAEAEGGEQTVNPDMETLEGGAESVQLGKMEPDNEMEENADEELVLAGANVNEEVPVAAEEEDEAVAGPSTAAEPAAAIAETPAETKKPSTRTRRRKMVNNSSSSSKPPVAVDSFIVGQWVEVAPHPKQPSCFNCIECNRKFNAKESSMKHFHWCDPSTPIKKRRAPKTNKKKSTTPKRPAHKRIGQGEKPLLENVKEMVKDLIVNVTPEQVLQTDRRGSDTRKKYTNIEKLKIINEVYDGEKPVDVAEKYGINRSLISKWNANKTMLLDAIQVNDKKCFDTKNRRKVKYEKLYDDLHKQFKAAEAQGVIISYRWIHDTAEKMFKVYFPTKTTLPQSFVSNFTKRYSLTYQKKYKKNSSSTTSTTVSATMTSAAIVGASSINNRMEEDKSPVRWHSNSREVPPHEQQPPASARTFEGVPLSFAMNYPLPHQPQLPQHAQHAHAQQLRQQMEQRQHLEQRQHQLDQRQQQHQQQSQHHVQPPHHHQQPPQQHYRPGTDTTSLLSEQMRLQVFS